MKFTKLAFFDFDGTLTDGDEYIYNEFFSINGIDRVKSLQNLHDCRAGLISYEELVRRDIEAFRSAMVTKDDMLAVVRKIPPMEGARELIKELKNRGYGIIIISGGIDIVVTGVYPDAAELFDEVHINKYIFDEKGIVLDAVPTPYDQQHKATGIRHMCEKYGVDIRDSIFTGDNTNDVDAARVAGISFAFNTNKQRLIEVATHHIQKKDLREILKYIQL